MNSEALKVTVIRHERERLSKCSLEGLKGRPWIEFYRWKRGFEYDCSGYTVLSVDGDEISEADSGRPLLLLDSTWRLLKDLEGCLVGDPVKRRIPEWVKTAYPRVSKVSEDPMNGLASVEALYAAKRFMGEQDDSILDGYHWKDLFLEQFE